MQEPKLHEWMREDGYEPPKVGDSWGEALVAINSYIEHLRTKIKRRDTEIRQLIDV